MVWTLPLLSRHKVTWPSGTSVRIYLASSPTNLCVRKSLSQETTGYSITSGCRVDLRFDDFCFPFMYEVQISTIFSCELCCVALRDEGFLTCVFRDKIGLLLSRLSPCSTPADTREVASDATFFPIAGQCCWRGCWCFPLHQKHCDDRSDFLVKLTCSCWMFLVVFISWFANAAASNVLAASTTSRNLTFSCVVLCLCPFPNNFTPRASDVKPVINWSLMSSSAKSWYSHCATWFRIFVSHDAIDSFSCCSRRNNFCRSPDTPTLAPWYSPSAPTTLWGFSRSASLRPRLYLYRSSRMP